MDHSVYKFVNLDNKESNDEPNIVRDEELTTGFLGGLYLMQNRFGKTYSNDELHNTPHRPHLSTSISLCPNEPDEKYSTVLHLRTLTSLRLSKNSGDYQKRAY